MCVLDVSFSELNELTSKLEYEQYKKDKKESRTALFLFQSDLAYDKTMDSHFSSNNNIRLKIDPQAQIMRYYDKTNKTNYLLAIKDDKYNEQKLIITNTRLISIKTIKEKRKPLKKPNDRVIMTTYEIDEDLPQQHLQIKKYIRGGSSRSYEKKSYTIKDLNKTPMSLFGLPMNKKYVLNSLYEDEPDFGI